LGESGVFNVVIIPNILSHTVLGKTSKTERDTDKGFAAI